MLQHPVPSATTVPYMGSCVRTEPVSSINWNWGSSTRNIWRNNQPSLDLQLSLGHQFRHKTTWCENIVGTLHSLRTNKGTLWFFLKIVWPLTPCGPQKKMAEQVLKWLSLPLKNQKTWKDFKNKIDPLKSCARKWPLAPLLGSFMYPPPWRATDVTSEHDLPSPHFFPAIGGEFLFCYSWPHVLVYCVRCRGNEKRTNLSHQAHFKLLQFRKAGTPWIESPDCSPNHPRGEFDWQEGPDQTWVLSQRFHSWRAKISWAIIKTWTDFCYFSPHWNVEEFGWVIT